MDNRKFFLITNALHGNGKADLSSVATMSYCLYYWFARDVTAATMVVKNKIISLL